ncbi:MAG TPA: hypothetical protein P5317_07665 [Myxococcota bacterium]|nr:hypothetical protein [Myxococcota bacterium]HRV17873.1 hypothetical protein [Myxococcota bacterium]
MANPCPIPTYVDKCPPTATYQVGGTDYIAFLWCDAGNNKDVLAVFQICDGVFSGAPEFYDPTTGAAYTPVGAVGRCKDSVDYEILCDKGTDPNTKIIAVWNNSTVPPTLSYFTPAADGTLTAYTPVGLISACPDSDVEDTQVCYVASVAGTGYAAGDQLLQILFWDTGESPPTLVATIWRNQSQNTVLTTPPTISDLTQCGGAKDHEIEILCDVNGAVTSQFIRRYVIDSLGGVSVVDTNLDGVTAYTPTGTVQPCSASASKPCLTCR